MLHFRLQKKKERCPFFTFTCVYFASGSKCGLSTPLTSGELAGGKLVLFIALHSSSLVLEKDGLSLTGGAKEKERREERKVREECLRLWEKTRTGPLLLMHPSGAG